MKTLCMRILALALLMGAPAPVLAGDDGGKFAGSGVQPVGGVDSSGNLQVISVTPTGALAGPTGTSSDQVQGTAADGAAAVGNPVQVGGKDGTGNAQTLLTNTDGSLQVSFTSTDPCQSSGVAKSGVVISATADTELVAISGSTVIYVCGFSANAAAGTAPSFRFIYGTGAVCATGTVGMTGAYLPSLNGTVNYAPGSTAFKTAAGQALCIDVGGTTPDIRGVLSYVQQ